MKPWLNGRMAVTVAGFDSLPVSESMNICICIWIKLQMKEKMLISVYMP